MILLRKKIQDKEGPEPQTKSKYIERGGARVFYRNRGPTVRLCDSEKKECTLILQGGYTTHPAAWIGQIDEFKGRYQVLTKENRGHWGTKIGDSNARTYLDDMVLDLIAVMDKEGIRSAVICGHSMWGGNAMRLYHRFPDRVSGLMLVAPAYRNPLELGFLRDYPRLHPVARFLADNAGVLEPLNDFKTKKLGESRIAWEALHKILLMTYMKEAHNPTHAIKMVKNAIRANIDAMAISMQALFLLDDLLLEKAHEINVPVFLVAGSNDPLVSPESVRVLAERIPGSVYEEFPNCAHFPMLSHPEKFNVLLHSLLRASCTQ